MQKVTNRHTNQTALKILSITFALIIIYTNSIWSQNANPSPLNFPTPKNIDNMLFYLQRDPNTNTLIYSLNLEKDGEINRSQPVSVYWLRYAEKGEKRDLGYIQRKFAYGILAKELSKDRFELRFVSHKKLPFYLLRSATDQKYYVSVTLNDKKIKINRLFIRIEGGSFWLPNVKYASIEGTELTTGKAITERIPVK
ncbi:DUF4833 domain-containing protein [Pedobacter sp. HDW13]|uniref:DUF4833 domain-containing protein n=1 Tax=unclassified Pedobacter TaxID=2628915 RepID=UPI000F5A95F8|nr:MULTISPECIES: DUF4833 domain-containing protein [unclassified Pedobacter]QIL38242.1 DUF4833 domain-containing protein [Pedobacter sp. HDW13]RQO73677.1 DUF4833 domain-containing protein [Pedobacter sp. KBW01]